MKIRVLLFPLVTLIIVFQCTEPVESILLKNDTQYDIEITFNNITIAATERISIKPGGTGTIALKGVWSTDSADKIGTLLKEYVVVRLFRGKNGMLVLSGDQAISKLSGNLRRENNGWIVRMSDIFK
jgi:hypothetical protein